ncbi:tripartite tricarboxylate transporter substrate-binding protein [Chelativorans sp. AA-79]|uniref:Bug family tripartite tricarboxylate transporter substrate binding protein n=1 Tax=Chelativorans sp. AA-79 TaxID=3028735 RepID=UPI0023F67824|nr:tripartite tricarboxylate transporter substrate-binding protein [Chelativorans sp. AA-79]WEX12271.1 tripartite tricarboxylate transporter substrate-binding protein [Chelativorans sp. AA-79]
MEEKMKALLLAVAVALLPTPLAWSQEFPTKPVKIVVPYAPGGSGDVTGRFIAEKLSDLWGQSTVVENIPGGGGAIGTAHVTQLPADGYTLLLHAPTYAMMPALRSDLPFDSEKDLTAVTIISEAQFMLVAGPRVKAKTLQDFIAEAKTREMFAAASGPGSSTHMGAELVASATGVPLTVVFYKGGAESILDVAAGRADVSVASVTSARSFIESGELKPLATLGTKRLDFLPDVPTFHESGIDAEEILWWVALVAKGTPAEIVDKINADIHTVMTTPEGSTFLEKQQATHPAYSPQQSGDYILSEMAQWKKVVEARAIMLK